MRSLSVAVIAMVAVAAAFVAVLLVPGVGDAAVAAAGWLRRAGTVGVVLFLAVFVIGSVALAPDSVFSISAGYAYGMFAGSAIALVGAMISAAVTCALARTWLRGIVARRLHRDRRLAVLDRAVRDRGAIVVILVRFAPVLPFPASNYLFAVTAITWRDFLVGTFVGMLPWTLAYAYLGSIAPVAIAMLHGHAPVVLPIVGIAMTIVAATTLSVLAQRVLRRRLAAM